MRTRESRPHARDDAYANEGWSILDYMLNK